MPEIKKHAPGAFCWAEVGTTDTKKTKAFYSELFGWKYEDRPAGQFGTYTMCKQGGKDLAGLYQLAPELLKMGVPPHWMSYVAVADADAACKKIQQHGGTVQQGPFDVMDVGRMAICKDPTGATFSIWQAKAHAGASVMGEHGTPCWFELSTRGVPKAEAFYKAVFGWSVKVDADQVYRELSAPGAPLPMGGMMELTPQHGPVPPHWLIYFTVEDCDGDAQRTKNLGGKVIVPPMDIPKVGRFAVLADPAGATFAIIKLALHPEHKLEAQTKKTAAPAPAKTSKKK
ncbi:MAG: VOC family protein [Planctomycetes bacterium]|nr:VOC family protein [Planctomycetota bacterium]